MASGISGSTGIPRDVTLTGEARTTKAGGGASSGSGSEKIAKETKPSTADAMTLTKKTESRKASSRESSSEEKLAKEDIRQRSATKNRESKSTSSNETSRSDSGVIVTDEEASKLEKKAKIAAGKTIERLNNLSEAEKSKFKEERKILQNPNSSEEAKYNAAKEIAEIVVESIEEEISISEGELSSDGKGGPGGCCGLGLRSLGWGAAVGFIVAASFTSAITWENEDFSDDFGSFGPNNVTTFDQKAAYGAGLGAKASAAMSVLFPIANGLTNYYLAEKSYDIKDGFSRTGKMGINILTQSLTNALAYSAVNAVSGGILAGVKLEGNFGPLTNASRWFLGGVVAENAKTAIKAKSAAKGEGWFEETKPKPWRPSLKGGVETAMALGIAALAGFNAVQAGTSLTEKMGDSVGAQMANAFLTEFVFNFTFNAGNEIAAAAIGAISDRIPDGATAWIPSYDDLKAKVMGPPPESTTTNLNNDRVSEVEMEGAERSEESQDDVSSSSDKNV